MSNNLNNSILLIGTGPMAVAYAKVLQALDIPFTSIGRGEASANQFLFETGVQPITGGLLSYLNNNTLLPDTKAIIATGTDVLQQSLKLLLSAGVNNILIEKPAAVSVEELGQFKDEYLPFAKSIFVAYNRRFYASVIEAEKLINEDGGLMSMQFEFTEWVHKIKIEKKPIAVLNNWFFANSTHVVDLAFFIAGKPIKWEAFTKNGELSWHEKTNFAGAGITDKQVLFSYLSNWESAGRWALELLTNKRRIYLKPLEGLMIQEKGTVNILPHSFDDQLDINFKPGLYKQVSAFLSGDNERLLNLSDHLDISENVYRKILGS